MKKRLALTSIICLLCTIFAPANSMTANVSAAEAYLDFDSITNRQLPFAYDGITAIGGGDGYGSIVTTGTTTISAYTSGSVLKTPTSLYTELVNAVAQAQSGSTIFIDPQCVIEISASIVVDKPLTIASSRGSGASKGALLKSSPTFSGYYSIFDIEAPNVRISGLRLRGNKDIGKQSRAIIAYSYVKNGAEIPASNVEIDNCDVSYFFDAIDLEEHTNTNGVLHEDVFKVHHNYIHENYVDGLGYGIVVDNAYAKIYANIFHNNRHDIAGTGHIKSGYEAYANIMLGGMSTQSNFDMHGDRVYSADGTTYTTSYTAGGFMHIHHNDFRNVNPQANIYPVGKPRVLCLIDNNRFMCDSVFGNGASIFQNAWGRTNSPNGYGNIVAVNNIFGDSYIGWYAQETWDKARTDNFIRIPSTNDLLMSTIEPTLSGQWISTSSQNVDYSFGDFDGDGITDIFKSEGNSWYYLPINTGYVESWRPLGGSSYKLGTMSLKAGSTDYYNFSPAMFFGNFNDDNKTDIMLPNGTQWDVSYGATTSWTNFTTSNLSASQIQMGKFSYAGYSNVIHDFFTSGTNGQWSIRYDGVAWILANSSTYPGFKLGDFNGDGLSDVLCATGSEWQYSSNARGSWVTLKSTNIGYNDMVIGDFNSDGKSDIICEYLGRRRVSLSGTGDISLLTTSNFPLTNFRYGNFN